MLGENNFIPFETSRLPQGSWLVFAPHPDDETFGIGGSIINAVKQGINVHVAILTDGALGGEGGGLKEKRKQEAWQASKILGIGSLHFFDYPDRGLVVDAATIDAVKSHIIDLKPVNIFFPSLFEYHPDHRATSLILISAINQLQDLKIDCYSYEISVHGFINKLFDITQVIDLKVRAMRVYNSQQQENDYEDLVTALNLTRSYTLPDTVRYAEGVYCYEQNELQNIEGFLLKRIKDYIKY
jgi:LmbE family N-acetylglucosaminyl deacetylase